MLKYIFHLSDLHIRNGDNKYSRYDEYNTVFNNTISSLNTNITNKNLSKSDFVIIITGDIFHNKNNIGNYGLLLYKNFITELIKIGKVIIIHLDECDYGTGSRQNIKKVYGIFKVNQSIIIILYNIRP